MLSTSIEHAAPLPTQKDYMLNVDAPSTAIQKIVLAMAIAGCIGVAAITAPREPATAAHAPLALDSGTCTSISCTTAIPMPATG